MKKIKTDLKTTQKMLLELPHWVFIEKVDPEVNTLSPYVYFATHPVSDMALSRYRGPLNVASI